MTTIAITNQKGGCGKTTTAINLAACLGKKQQRVLLIDMDPQGHASLGLGKRCEDIAGLCEVLLHDASMKDVIIPQVVSGVDLVPATISLAAVEHLLVDIPERERQLMNCLEDLPNTYDFIVIDCPPNLGMLSFNALRVADTVLIPIEMSLFSLDGIERVHETIELVAKQYDIDFEILILPTLVDYRTKFTKNTLLEIRDRFPTQTLPINIHCTVRLKEAAWRGIPLLDYAPDSPAANDYMQLADKILASSEKHNIFDSNLARLENQITEELEAEDIRIPDEVGYSSQVTKTNAHQNAKSTITDELTKKVVLRFNNIAADNLKIAGDFNDWVPDRGVETHRDDGGITKTLNIKPGKYQYRIIVDGTWQKDPTNPIHVTNNYGEINSILEINSEPELVVI